MSKPLWAICFSLFLVTVSAQKISLQYEQNLIQSPAPRGSGGLLSEDAKILNSWDPGLSISWHGLSAGLVYYSHLKNLNWVAGYTITITPQLRLSTHGDGFKFGMHMGILNREIESGEKVEDRTVRINWGYEYRHIYYGMFYRRNTLFTEDYGFGLGYTFY